MAAFESCPHCEHSFGPDKGNPHAVGAGASKEPPFRCSECGTVVPEVSGL